MILDFSLVFLFKDPDQAENGEEDGMIRDAMDAYQPDCGEGKETHQHSYGKEDDNIKVRYEISIYSRKMKMISVFIVIWETLVLRWNIVNTFNNDF